MTVRYGKSNFLQLQYYEMKLKIKLRNKLMYFTGYYIMITIKFISAK